jgi:hypothetical protein
MLSAPPSAAEVFKNRLRFNDTIHLASSNGLSRPKILDLGRSVAEPGEDVVVVRSELRGDADLAGVSEKCHGEPSTFSRLPCFG